MTKKKDPEKVLYDRLAKDIELPSPKEVQVLETLVASLVRLDKARTELLNGEFYTDPKGMLRLHPAVVITKNCEAEIRNCWKQLQIKPQSNGEPNALEKIMGFAQKKNRDQK